MAISKFDIQNVLTLIWGPGSHFGGQFDQKPHFSAISSRPGGMWGWGGQNWRTRVSVFFFQFLCMLTSEKSLFFYLKVGQQKVAWGFVQRGWTLKWLKPVYLVKMDGQVPNIYFKWFWSTLLVDSISLIAFILISVRSGTSVDPWTFSLGPRSLKSVYLVKIDSWRYILWF